AGVALRGELLKFELRHETLSNFCTRGELPAAVVERGPEPRGDAIGLAAPAAPATPGEVLELCREGLHGGPTIPRRAARACRGSSPHSPWRRRWPNRRRRCRRPRPRLRRCCRP